MLQEFVNYLNEKVGRCVYVWGGQGEKGSEITEAWIRKKDKKESDAKRSIKFWNELKKTVPASEIEAFDCSGLGIYFFYKLKKVLKGDYTAHGMMGLCEKITRSKLRKGDWVFKLDDNGKAGHIGYVVDDALNVVEAKGRDHGVVKSNVSKNNWNAYGRPPFYDYEADSEPTMLYPRAAVCVCDTFVNIRETPNGKILGSVLNGHPLVVQGKKGDSWLTVATLNGEKAIGGYIFADHVSN